MSVASVKSGRNLSRAVKIQFSSYDAKTIDKACKDITVCLRRLGVEFSGPVPLPTDISKFSVNRSPHIDRKSMEQIEIREHKRVLIVKTAEPGVMQEVSNITLPYGVDIKVKFVEL